MKKIEKTKLKNIKSIFFYNYSDLQSYKCDKFNNIINIDIKEPFLEIIGKETSIKNKYILTDENSRNILLAVNSIKIKTFLSYKIYKEQFNMENMKGDYIIKVKTNEGEVFIGLDNGLTLSERTIKDFNMVYLTFIGIEQEFYRKYKMFL